MPCYLEEKHSQYALRQHFALTPLLLQVIRLVAAGEEFLEWLVSAEAAIPQLLVDAAAAEKLPTETLMNRELDREVQCRQMLSIFQVRV